MKKILFLILIVIPILLLPKILEISPFSNLIVQQIEKTIHSPCTIERFKLSWKAPQQIENLKVSKDNLQITLPSVIIKNNFFNFLFKSKTIEIKKGSIEEGSNAIFNISASIDQSNYKLNAKTKVAGLDGFVEGSSSIFENKKFIDINCSNVPTSISYKLIKLLYPNLSKYNLLLLGDYFSTKALVQLKDMEGPIELVFTAPNLETKASFLVQNNEIKLQKEFILHAFLTKETNDILFSNSKMTLKIAPEGFNCPIDNLRKINIERGLLDLGIITAKNVKELANLSNFIKIKRKEMEFWFAPVDFSLKNNILKVRRLDFLVNNAFHFCAWGTIDILNQFVDGIFGITAQALEQAFGIKNLPEDYVIKIPVRGYFKSLKIDTAAASKEISGLVASQAIQGIMGIPLLPKSSPDVPPPNLPFPWEGQIKAKPKSHPNFNQLFKLFR